MENILPLLAFIAVIIGTFFSLSFSPHKGAASIGLILSAAIAILMLVTFIVLPALLAVFEPMRSREQNSA